MTTFASAGRSGASPLVRRLAVVLILLSWRAAAADGGASGECDIQVDGRMKVYMVTVSGAPYRNKRYLTWDDALKLRDVLVSAGDCDRAAGPRRCTVDLVAAGDYAVLRDGVNFDPYAKLRTVDAARAYARRLERAKLCTPLR